jgi:hypothetical protein
VALLLIGGGGALALRWRAEQDAPPPSSAAPGGPGPAGIPIGQGGQGRQGGQGGPGSAGEVGPSGEGRAGGTSLPPGGPGAGPSHRAPLSASPDIPGPQENGQPDPVDPVDPYPRPVITEPRADAVDCGLRITAYITHAEGADVVYAASGATNAGPGGTEVTAHLTYDGEIWSAVIYPNYPTGYDDPTTVSWQIKAFNGPVKAAPSDIVDTRSSTCYT